MYYFYIIYIHMFRYMCLLWMCICVSSAVACAVILCSCVYAYILPLVSFRVSCSRASCGIRGVKGSGIRAQVSLEEYCFSSLENYAMLQAEEVCLLI